MRLGRLLFPITAALLLLAAAAGWWFWSTRPRERPLAPRWEAVVSTVATHQLLDPFAVAVAPDGTIFASEGVDAHRITRIAPDGSHTLHAGGRRGFADGSGSSAQFDVPSGLALSPEGALYVADTANNSIRRIAPDGMVSTVVSPGEGLNGPIGLAVAPDGTVIVADTYNDRICSLGRDGRLTVIAGGTKGFVDGSRADAQFDTPVGVATDRQGNIYVADAGNGAVRVITTAGTVATIAPGAADGSLRPRGIAADAAASIFVTDERGWIVEIRGDGGARVVAGLRAGFADGDGGTARFRAPSGIAVESPGRLLVADRRNGRLRRVTADSRREFRAPAPPIVARFDAVDFDRAPLLWPFAPIEGPFEITGTLGEPRGAGADRLHAGLDVHAPEGTHVNVVRSASVDDPLAAADFGSINESVRIGPVAYVHMRVGRDHRGTPFPDDRFVIARDETGAVRSMRVKRGASFATGEVIGTVNRFYHAHLNVGWPGEEINPLRFRLLGFVDTIRPVIARNGIRVVGEDGRILTARQERRLLVSGPVRIIADAWDQVDGNLGRRRLGLYRLGYRILDRTGQPIPGFEGDGETLRFDRHPEAADAASIVYAGGSGIPVYGNRSTRFLYVVTSRLRDGVATHGTFDSAALPPGDYTLRVLAADISGNEALANRDLAIRIIHPQDDRGSLADRGGGGGRGGGPARREPDGKLP